jgi:small subunit ribosomal protein S21
MPVRAQVVPLWASARLSYINIQIDWAERGDGLPGIRVKDGESFESALRRFKKKCEKAGIMADLRRHQHFEKPSERRKRKLNAARRKNLARRQQEI